MTLAYLFITLAACQTPGPTAIASTTDRVLERARGTVFVDSNRNRKFDPDETTLAGIKVSNGQQIVLTDQKGRYELPVEDDTILFVIKPSGYRTPLNEHRLPQFFYIHKPKGSPSSKYPGVAPTGSLPPSIDFPLYPQKEPQQFKAILFGDPQPRDQQEIDFVTRDVVEELIGTDASFGVTLGDIMFDDLALFESQAQSIALIGIPWYNVIGNHDINFDARARKHANETFERVFGPSYYSFDYGKVHFLVLDNIDWIVPTDGRRSSYRGGIGKQQLEFIKNDLAMIPADQMVVLLMHIPLESVHDRHGLYRLIEKRPFCISISGHTHHHEHRFIRKQDGWLGPEPHHHIINVTVSGSWWSGKTDERGIPHTTMADGAPNGYSILSFDGNDYRLDFKAAGKPAGYQMRIHLPDEVAENQLASTEVWVNVFNGSEKSIVDMKIGDQASWTRLERTLVPDPAYEKLYQEDQALTQRTRPHLPKPKTSPHLWRGTLPADLKAGVYRVQVRTQDMHGRTFNGNRVIRVVSAVEAKESK